MKGKLLIKYCFQIFSILSVPGIWIHYCPFTYKTEQFLNHCAQALSTQYIQHYCRKSGHVIYPYYKLTRKEARLVWQSHKTAECIGIECLMLAWVAFNWRVGRHSTWLQLVLLCWPAWGYSNMHHLKVQTCVKRLGSFNEGLNRSLLGGTLCSRTPHHALQQSACQGSVGAGCSWWLGDTPQVLSPTVVVSMDQLSSRRSFPRSWSRAGTITVHTNGDKLKLLQWKWNSSRLLFQCVWSTGSPCVRIGSLEQLLVKIVPVPSEGKPCSPLLFPSLLVRFSTRI